MREPLISDNAVSAPSVDGQRKYSTYLSTCDKNGQVGDNAFLLFPICLIYANNTNISSPHRRFCN